MGPKLHGFGYGAPNGYSNGMPSGLGCSQTRERLDWRPTGKSEVKIRAKAGRADPKPHGLGYGEYAEPDVVAGGITCLS